MLSGVFRVFVFLSHTINFILFQEKKDRFISIKKSIMIPSFIIHHYVGRIYIYIYSFFYDTCYQLKLPMGLILTESYTVYSSCKRKYLSFKIFQVFSKLRMQKNNTYTHTREGSALEIWGMWSTPSLLLGLL